MLELPGGLGRNAGPLSKLIKSEIPGVCEGLGYITFRLGCISRKDGLEKNACLDSGHNDE